MDDAAAWEAIWTRDRYADGKFVYAARTTGLYCRPSCPARHPLPKNTVLFSTVEGAERNGFLPCSRCAPASNAETVAESCVKGVIHHIESHFREQTTLGKLSKRTGLTANYLRQAFKRIVGVTPKVYCDARRIDGFKTCLKLGESVASSGYSAGYGSSRALYEGAVKHMGMTPAAYRRGGDVRIRFSFVRGVFCQVLIAGTRRGFCAILQGSDRKKLVHELRREFPNATLIHDAKPPARWVAAVRLSLKEDPFVSRLALELRRRVFRARVVDLLR